MDILDEVTGAPEDIDLNSLIDTPNQTGPMLPVGAVRNRAASTALLAGDSSKAVENYQVMMQEAEANQNVLQSQMKEQVLASTEKDNIKVVMDVLADPSVPLEKKKEVISGIRTSQFLKDTGSILQSNMLMSESDGEDFDAEEARINTADALRELYQARQEIQGLVNAHAASLPNADIGTAGDMAAAWVLPFGNNVIQGKVNKAQANKTGETSLWKRIKGFVFPGSGVADIRETLESLPPEKRVEYAKELIDTISNNAGVIFSNDNQFAQFDKARAIFEEGGYSSFDEFLDNVSPLLDVIGIGQVVRGLKKAPKLARAGEEVSGDIPPGVSGEKEFVHPAEWELVDDRPRVPESKRLPNPQLRITLDDKLKRIEYNSIARKHNPASPAAIVNQSNPAAARSLHDTVMKTESDSVAEALYGTSRIDAIADDILPQVETSSGAVVSKTPDIERNLRREMHVSDELLYTINNSGATYYTVKEKAAARAHLVNNFSAAEGMSMNEAMSSFKVDGGRIQINAVYGTDEGSFSNAKQAFEQAKYALRQQGILDEEIEILRKEGLDHVPVSLDEVGDTPGNYLVRIKTSHEIDPTDITDFERMDVRRNLFDRIPQFVTNRQGSVSRYMFDAASMLHPTYTGAASVASDMTSKLDKVLLDIAGGYSDRFIKMPKARQAKMEEYIREANYQGIKFDHADLVGRGFSPEEIDTLRSWRDFWDAHFYLENYDVVRTLNSQGYQLFKNKNATLYAKPVPKNQNIQKVYDPATDSVVVHTKADGDILYLNGGTYAKLRRPSTFGSDTAEYMVVRNTPTEYLRKLRDSDQVLNYRDGYFQIQYTAPRFVDEVEYDSFGRIASRRAVAVAGDTAEAERFANRMRSVNGKEYIVRADERGMARGEDDWWDVNSAQGRIAQRHRGKLLEDGSGLNHLGDGSYIMNPVDSAVRAAKSIGGRTISRPMLEAAKARAIYQYADLFPSNGMGGVRWPKSVKEIGQKGEQFTSNVADARTTFEYINYLENGYINSIDEGFKQVMNGLADVLGKYGMSRSERAALGLGESRGPTGIGKNFVFQAYIGTNILRQWIVQAHQVVRTYSYNPVGWATGKIHTYLGQYIGVKMGTLQNASAEAKAFVQFIDDSGLMSSVDKQNLVRGTLNEAADSTNKAWRAIGKPFEITRRIGFDVGEQANLLGHAAAVYDRYKRIGKDLTDKSVRDEAYAEIRAISYDMNFAGDMPYNQTTPSIVLQFMQVPHKAFLQATNRKIPVDARMRMLAADMVLWGTPAYLIADTIGVDILPEDPELRELFLYGAESMLLNRMFTQFSGEKTDIDFSSLAPYEMSGWGEFFTAMYSGGMSEMLLNSPAGQLFLKDGGRVQNAIASMARYFNVVEDIDEDGQTFLEVMNEIGKISSGWNNAVKARILLEARKRYDQYGDTIDQEVNHVEAWAQLFGFSTGNTRDLYLISKEWSSDEKAYKEDVLKVYNDIKRYYATKLEVSNSDPRFITKVTGRVLKVFENDPKAQAIIANQLAMDLRGKDQNLLGLMMRRSGIPDVKNMRDEIKRMPVSEDQKKMMLERLDDIQKIRNEMEK